jgi:hypothetical protein
VITPTQTVGRTLGKEDIWITTSQCGNLKRLMEAEANRAHNAATELEALVLLLPSEKSRQLAQVQVKASHKQAKEFRELAQQSERGLGADAFAHPRNDLYRSYSKRAYC